MKNFLKLFLVLAFVVIGSATMPAANSPLAELDVGMEYAIIIDQDQHFISSGFQVCPIVAQSQTPEIEFLRSEGVVVPTIRSGVNSDLRCLYNILKSHASSNGHAVFRQVFRQWGQVLLE
jgi:hypothetical protein